MRAFAEFCVVAVLGAALLGCGLRQSSAETAEGAGDESEMTQAELDEAKMRAYMAAVERRARRRHVDVLWVRPPHAATLSIKDQEELRRLMRNQPPVP